MRSKDTSKPTLDAALSELRKKRDTKKDIIKNLNQANELIARVRESIRKLTVKGIFARPSDAALRQIKS